MKWRQENHIKTFQSEKKQKEPPVHTVINPASWELLKCHALAMKFLDPGPAFWEEFSVHLLPGKYLKCLLWGLCHFCNLFLLEEAWRPPTFFQAQSQDKKK